MPHIRIPERPVLKPWCQVVRCDETVTVRCGEAVTTFAFREGAAVFDLLLNCLDGRTLHDIEDMLGERAEAGLKLLTLLSDEGFITEAPAARYDSPATLALLRDAGPIAGVDTPTLLARRAEAAVRVVGDGPVSATLTTEIAESGIRIVSGDEAAPLVVVDGFDLAVDVGEWNRSALQAGQPWFHIGPWLGSAAVVGPLFVPGETCCYACFRQRSAANRTFPAAKFAAFSDASGAWGLAPGVRLIAAGLAAEIVIRDAVGAPHGARGGAYVLECGTKITLSHGLVYRVPRCAECSPVRDRPVPAPWFEDVRD